jgi:hypothetical protein
VITTETAHNLFKIEGEIIRLFVNGQMFILGHGLLLFEVPLFKGIFCAGSDIPPNPLSKGDNLKKIFSDPLRG